MKWFLKLIALFPVLASLSAHGAPAALVTPEESGIVGFLLRATLFGSVWVLWLLLILSVISFAVIGERIAFFRRERVDYARLMETLTACLEKNDAEGLVALTEELPSLERGIIAQALQNREKGLHAIEKSMSSFVARERHKLDRDLIFLGTLGNNAPFIGLFGTVLGIIQAFHALASNPAGGPAVVMSGISESLVATAVGLFVAIPSVVAFNAFQRIVKRRMANLESLQDLLATHLGGPRERKRAS